MKTLMLWVLLRGPFVNTIEQFNSRRFVSLTSGYVSAPSYGGITEYLPKSYRLNRPTVSFLFAQLCPTTSKVHTENTEYTEIYFALILIVFCLTQTALKPQNFTSLRSCFFTYGSTQVRHTYFCDFCVFCVKPKLLSFCYNQRSLRENYSCFALS